MADLNSVSETVYKKAPLWGRLLVNVLGIVFAYILTYFLVLAFEPPNIFIYFIFLSSLLFGLFLPHLRYSKQDRWLSVTFLFLLVWAIILFVLSPIFTKQYFLTEASKILPPYSSVEQTSMTYERGDASSSSAVRVVYRSSQVEEDYQKMNELYKTFFLGKGYIVDSEEVGSHVYFKKKNSPSPDIFLGISNQQNSISVIISPGRLHCINILFIFGFESFESCQVNSVE